ncbi:MAG: hypothetical protein K8U57_23100 [Planctomycetes bacterium]|nr:hypothetical protein [Planctomycetota bacterium]
MKVLVASGRGGLGAGAITLTGATAGDTVTGVICQTKGGEFQTVPDGAFESTISVDNQIQQLLSGLGTRSLSTDPPQSGSWGYWRFVFLLN